MVVVLIVLTNSRRQNSLQYGIKENKKSIFDKT